MRGQPSAWSTGLRARPAYREGSRPWPREEFGGGSRRSPAVSFAQDLHRHSHQFYDLLAEVLARQQADERFGCSGQALRDGFAVLDAARRYALRELLQGLRPEFQVLRHDEAA